MAGFSEGVGVVAAGIAIHRLFILILYTIEITLKSRISVYKSIYLFFVFLEVSWWVGAITLFSNFSSIIKKYHVKHSIIEVRLKCTQLSVKM